MVPQTELSVVQIELNVKNSTNQDNDLDTVKNSLSDFMIVVICPNLNYLHNYSCNMCSPCELHIEMHG